MSNKKRISDTQDNTTHAGLAGWVIHFAGFLKDNGFTLFQSSIHDALRSLEEIDITRKEDFLASLRATLAKTDLEWHCFIDLFKQFLKREEESAKKADDNTKKQDSNKQDGSNKIIPHAHTEQSAGMTDTNNKKWLEGIPYSPVSMIEKKDLSRFNNSDIKIAQLALKRITEPFRINVSHRAKKGARIGKMDFPRIMRKSFKNAGTPIELFYREKKKKLKKLVVLTDVSGSMDQYTRFVLPLVLGLRGVGPKAEVFAFSTSLVRLTFILHHLSIDKALESIAKDVPDWSGGTKIGYSLHQFTKTYGKRLLTHRTVVIILSDGWDLGGKELLRREMELINKKANSVIWLNPLAGDSDYRPVCHGMRIALPYVDYFLPANSLESLKKVAMTISGIMAM